MILFFCNHDLTFPTHVFCSCPPVLQIFWTNNIRILEILFSLHLGSKGQPTNTGNTATRNHDGNKPRRPTSSCTCRFNFVSESCKPSNSWPTSAPKRPIFQQFPSSWTSCFVKRNKNYVEILPRKHSRTLVESISTGCCDETGTQLFVTINVTKGDKKGPSTILWYYVLDSKMCKNIHSFKFKCLCTSRGHTQRFARFCSSHSHVVLGVPKPCVLLHLCASKSKKHQMQTVSKTLKHCYLHWFLGPPLKRYC